MNRFLFGVAQAVTETFDLPEPIVEIGSYQVEGQEAVRLRSLFPGRDYTGIDMRAGPGVDCVANVENLPQETGSVGTVIAMSTFEHVRQFWRGFDEVQRVLRPDGIFLVACPFFFEFTTTRTITGDLPPQPSNPCSKATRARSSAGTARGSGQVMSGPWHWDRTGRRLPRNSSSGTACWYRSMPMSRRDR